MGGRVGGGQGYGWCANIQTGHSCRFFGCSDSSAFCNNHMCFCKYGMIQNTGGDCVKDNSWSEYTELAATNGTIAAINEDAENNDFSDYMVATNIFWMVGYFTVFVAA